MTRQSATARDLIVEHGPLERDAEYPIPAFGYTGDGNENDDGEIVITPLFAMSSAVPC